MNIEQQVDAFLANTEARPMTTERFFDTLANKYDALKSMLVAKDVSVDDAEDSLQELAVWGASQDWNAWTRNQVRNALLNGKRPVLKFTYLKMKQTIGWQWRNRRELDMNRNEVAIGQGSSTELEPSELDGVLAFDAELDSMIEDWQAEVPVEDDSTNDEVSTDAYLACLTGKQQQVVLLRNQGLDQWDIAERIGVDQSSVARRLMGAYERLCATFHELRVAYKVYDYKDDYEPPAGRPHAIIARFTGEDPYERHGDVTNTWTEGSTNMGLWPAFMVQATSCPRIPWDELNAEKGSGTDYRAWYMKRQAQRFMEGL